LEHAKVSEEQKENETALAQLSENIEKQQKDMDELKSRKSYSDYELQDLTNKKALLQADLEKRQKEERDRIGPELSRLEGAVSDLMTDIESAKKDAEKKKQMIEELDKMKAEAELRSEKIKEEHEKVQEEYIAAQQKPLNVSKMLQGDENGMKIVDEELNKLNAKKEDLEEKIKAATNEFVVIYL